MEVNNKISNMPNTIDISNYNTKNDNLAKEDKNIPNTNNKKSAINKDILDKAISELNDKYKLVNKEFSYVVHEKTKRISVKVKDSESGEIINEIPSEESLDLSAKIMEMVGLLIDKKS